MTRKRNAEKTAAATDAPPSAVPAAGVRPEASAAAEGERATSPVEPTSGVHNSSTGRDAKRKGKTAVDDSSRSSSSRSSGASAPSAKKQRTQPPSTGRTPLVKQSPDATRWRDALRLYPRVLDHIASRKRSQQDKEKLLELDRWFQDELPVALLERAADGAYMTAEELSRLTQWKLSRGTFRPKLQQMVDGLDPKTVMLVTRQAFSFVAAARKDNECSPDTQKKLLQDGSFRKALETLTGLSGVGPATASAILCAYAPSLAPFFADDAAQTLLPTHKIAYTAPYYMRYATAVWEKACELNEAMCDPSADRFTVHDVEKALWCDTLSQKFGIED